MWINENWLAALVFAGWTVAIRDPKLKRLARILFYIWFTIGNVA